MVVPQPGPSTCQATSYQDSHFHDLEQIHTRVQDNIAQQNTNYLFNRTHVGPASVDIFLDFWKNKGYFKETENLIKICLREKSNLYQSKL